MMITILSRSLSPLHSGASGRRCFCPSWRGQNRRCCFTLRTESLARHSGQISFPGGRSEEGDLSPMETALRETQEETGIAAGFITVAGYLRPLSHRHRL